MKMVKLFEDPQHMWHAGLCADGSADVLVVVGKGRSAGSALRQLALAVEAAPFAPETVHFEAIPIALAGTAEESTTERPAPPCRANSTPVTGANAQQVGGRHYKTSIEHWDYVLANDIPYLEAVAIKYLTRWRKKGGVEDIQKALHYVNKLLEVEAAKNAAAAK